MGIERYKKVMGAMAVSDDGEWVRVEDVRALIDDRIKYIEGNAMYPAFCMNGMVEGMKMIRDHFENKEGE